MSGENHSEKLHRNDRDQEFRPDLVSEEFEHQRRVDADEERDSDGEADAKAARRMGRLAIGGHRNGGLASHLLSAVKGAANGAANGGGVVGAVHGAANAVEGDDAKAMPTTASDVAPSSSSNGASPSVTIGGHRNGNGHGVLGALRAAVEGGAADDAKSGGVLGALESVAGGATNGGAVVGAIEHAITGAANGSVASATNGAAKGSVAGATNGAPDAAVIDAISGAANGASNDASAPNGAAHGRGLQGVINAALHGAADGAVSGAGEGALDGVMNGGVRGAVNGAAQGASEGAVSGAIEGVIDHLRGKDDASSGADAGGASAKGGVRGAVDGAVSGATDGAINGAVEGAVHGAMTGGGVRGAVDGALHGAGDGAVSGGIEGAVDGAMPHASETVRGALSGGIEGAIGGGGIGGALKGAIGGGLPGVIGAIMHGGHANDAKGDDAKSDGAAPTAATGAAVGSSVGGNGRKTGSGVLGQAAGVQPHNATATAGAATTVSGEPQAVADHQQPVGLNPFLAAVMPGELADELTPDGAADAVLGGEEQHDQELDQIANGAQQDPASARQAKAHAQQAAVRQRQAVQQRTNAQTARASTSGQQGAARHRASGQSRLAAARTRGDHAQHQQRQAAAAKKVKKAKSIAEVKAKLEATFKAKSDALKADIDKQRTELKTKLAAEKQKLATEIQAQDAKLAADLAKRNADVGKKIDDKKHAAEAQNHAELAKAEHASKAQQDQVTAAGATEAQRITTAGKTEGNAAKHAAHQRAASIRANARKQVAGLGKEEGADQRAKSILHGAESQAHAAEAQGKHEADNRVERAHHDADAAKAKAATQVAGLKGQLDATRTQLAGQLAATLTQCEAERQTMLADVQKEIAASKKEMQAKTDESNVRINQLEQESNARIDALEQQTKKKIQQQHDDLVIKLDGPNAARELAKLDDEANKVCEQIDKAVGDAQKSVRQEVEETSANAARQTQARIAAVQAEGKKAQERIATKAAETERKIDAHIAQLELKNKQVLEAQERDSKQRTTAAVADLHAQGDKAVGELKKDSATFAHDRAVEEAAAAAKLAAEEKAKADAEKARLAEEKRKQDAAVAAEAAKKAEFERRTKGAANDLFAAMDGWGTDEKKVFRSLQGKSPEELAAIKAAYQAKTGHSLETDITSEMGGNDLKEAKALLSQDPVQSRVAALQNAMQGWGTDEKKVKETLASMTDPALRAKVIEEYEKQTGDKLSKVLAAEGMAKDGVNPNDFKVTPQGPQLDPAKVDQLANSKDVKSAASAILAATDRWGTDERAVFDALKGKSPEEIAAIRKAFKEHSGGKDLDDVIEDEMSGTDLKRAKALLSTDPVRTAVAELHNAAAGWGTDTKQVHDTLKGIKDPELRKQVAAEYEKETGQSLDAMLEDELSGFDKDKARAYVRGNEAEIAAVEADEAMHGGFLTNIADGVADTVGVDRQQVRNAVGGAIVSAVVPFGGVAAAFGMTPGTDFGTDNKALYAALESAKSKEERDALIAAYKARTGHDLMTDVNADLEGKEKDVARYIMAGDTASAEAAKMAAAADGIGTDKAAIYASLEGAKSKEERDAIIAKYNELYGKNGQTFEKMIDSELSALDKAKAQQLAKSGKMDDGFALYYAMNEGWLGIGTDEALLKERLQGKSKEEIAKLKAEYAAAAQQYGGRANADLIADVQGETSGRDGHELSQSLKGNPTTLEEMRQRLAEDYAFERTEEGWVGKTAMWIMNPMGAAMGQKSTDIANGLTDMWSGSGQRLDQTHREIEEKYLQLKNDPRFKDYDKYPPGSPERAAMDRAMMSELSGKADWQDGDLKAFEEAKDATADAASTAATIAVGAVITIASGGTAAPAVVALLSGLAGVSTKMLIKGGSMSNEEIVQDVAAVIAEAAAAGIVKIEKIEKLCESVGKLAGANNPLLANILKEATEEAIESGSEEFINAILDPSLYKGDLADWAKGVAQRTGKAMITGAYAGGVSSFAGEYIPKGATWKGRAAAGAVNQSIGEVATAVIDPATYEGSNEEKLTQFGRRVGEAALRGARDSLGGEAHHDVGEGDGHGPGATPPHHDVDTKTNANTPAHVDTTTSTNTNTNTETSANPSNLPAVYNAGHLPAVTSSSNASTNVSASSSDVETIHAPQEAEALRQLKREATNRGITVKLEVQPTVDEQGRRVFSATYSDGTKRTFVIETKAGATTESTTPALPANSNAVTNAKAGVTDGGGIHGIDLADAQHRADRGQYPQALVEALRESNPAKRAELANKAIAEFGDAKKHPGEGRAYAALLELDGNVEAQLELAHHFAVFREVFQFEQLQQGVLERTADRLEKRYGEGTEKSPNPNAAQNLETDLNELTVAKPGKDGSAVDRAEANGEVPASVANALRETDTTKRAELVATMIADLQESGRPDLVAKLEKLASNPAAQAVLAYKLLRTEQLSNRDGKLMMADRKLTPEEVRSMVVTHLALANQNRREGVEMRKIIPKKDIEALLSSKYGNATVGGYFGAAANTEGMNATQMQSALGLDYTIVHDQKRNKDGSVIYEQPFKQTPEGALQPFHDEVFHLDFAQTQEMADRTKIPVSPSFYAQIKALAATDAQAAELLGKVVVEQNSGPYRGTGATISEHGKASINQENKLEGGRVALPNGATLEKTNDKGERVVIATYKTTKLQDGSEHGEWVLSDNLTPGDKLTYQQMIAQRAQKLLPPAKTSTEVASSEEVKAPVTVATDENLLAPPAKKSLVGDTSHLDDLNGDGVQDRARVGVDGTSIPDSIPRLPGLSPEQAAAEERFARAYERDPKALAAEYLAMVTSGQTDKEAKNFATDDAKLLSPDYNPATTGPVAEGEVDPKIAARGHMNIAVHQTANAVAKLAFTMRLDQIAGDPNAPKKILVTAGGVGAGKSYAIDNNPTALKMKAEASAVWDSAGEQNSTELPWVIAEAKKRGIEVAVVYVHRRPEQSWENMKFGVIPRAAKTGRMVDARLHADSYAEGARNFDAVQKAAAGDSSVKFVVIDATGDKPAEIDHLPKGALNLNSDEVHARNVAFLETKQDELPEHVVQGGNAIGEKIWGASDSAAITKRHEEDLAWEAYERQRANEEAQRKFDESKIFERRERLQEMERQRQMNEAWAQYEAQKTQDSAAQAFADTQPAAFFKGVQPGTTPASATPEQKATFAKANETYQQVRNNPFFDESTARLQWARVLSDSGIEVEGGPSHIGSQEQASEATAVLGRDKKVAQNLPQQLVAADGVSMRSPTQPAAHFDTCKTALAELSRSLVGVQITHIEGDRITVLVKGPDDMPVIHTIEVKHPDLLPRGQIAGQRDGNNANETWVWVSKDLADDQVTRALGSVISQVVARVGGAQGEAVHRAAQAGQLDAMLGHLTAVETKPAAPVQGSKIEQAVAASKQESPARIRAEIDLQLARMGLVPSSPTFDRQLAALPYALAQRLRTYVETRPALAVNASAVADAAHVTAPAASGDEAMRAKSTVLADSPVADRITPYTPADHVTALELRATFEAIAEVDQRLGHRDQKGTQGNGQIEIAQGETMRRRELVQRAQQLMAALQLGGTDTKYYDGRLAELEAVFPGLGKDLSPMIKSRVEDRLQAVAADREAEAYRERAAKKSNEIAQLLTGEEPFLGDRLVIGDGPAGLANIATLDHKAGTDGFINPHECLVLGGEDLIGRMAKAEPGMEWGQRAGVFDPTDGGQAHAIFRGEDGKATGELQRSSEDAGSFATVGAVSNAFDLARDRMGIARVNAKVLKVELRPADASGWPDKARDRKVRVQIEVAGTTKWIYLNHADVTVGLGTAMLPDSSILSKGDKDELFRNKAIVGGDEVMTGRNLGGKRVLVLGYGPTGAWASVQAAKQGATQVDWTGSMGTEKGNASELAGLRGVDRVQEAFAKDANVNTSTDRILAIKAMGEGAEVTFAKGAPPNEQLYTVHYDAIVSAIAPSNTAQNVVGDGKANAGTMLEGIDMRAQGVREDGSSTPVLESSEGGDHDGAVRVLGGAAWGNVAVNSAADKEELRKRRADVKGRLSADSPDARVMEATSELAETANKRSAAAAALDTNVDTKADADVETVATAKPAHGPVMHDSGVATMGATGAALSTVTGADAKRTPTPFSAADEALITEQVQANVDAYKRLTELNVADRDQRVVAPTADPVQSKEMIENLMGSDVVDGHRVPAWFQYQKVSGELYRADNRPIEQVFAEGFEARGTHNSVGLHVAGVPGQYISFTKRIQFARDWHEMGALQRPDGASGGTGGGGVFVIRGSGIDIDNGVSGADVPAAQRGYMLQSEVAIVGGVAPQDILGAYVPDEHSPNGYRFVRNHAAGPTPEASTTSTLELAGNLPSQATDTHAGGEAMRGEIALSRGDNDAAEAHFKAVLAVEPNNSRAVWGMERIAAEREHRAPRAELFYATGTKAAADVLAPKTAAPVGQPTTVRTVAHGESIDSLIAELGARTRATGHEYAIVTMRDGARLVVTSNQADALELPEGVRRIIVHTHPSGAAHASDGDIVALRQLGDTERGGQRHSYIAAINGDGQDLVRFNGDPAKAQEGPGFTVTVNDPGNELGANGFAEVDPNAQTATVDPAAPAVPTEAAKADPNAEREPKKPAEPAKPKTKTLGELMKENGYTVESVQQSPDWFAQQLLIAKGVSNPPQSAISQTSLELAEAIKAGKGEAYTPSYDAGMLVKQDGINERLGNIFSEKHVFTPQELEPSALQMDPGALAQMKGNYESGKAGMILAASFINTGHRSEGDFSHAYGDNAWQGFMRATTMLDAIPKGQLLEHLNVDTILETNRLIYAQDTGLQAKALRAIAMVGRGGRWDVGGELREGNQYARPEHYSPAEQENLREAGVRVQQWGKQDENGGLAGLHYPAASEVRPRLEKLIADLKADLAKPGADPIMAASQFQRHFVALHPFGDSNGRTSRVLMNRILAEFNMPPAIFQDQNRDISLSPEEWRNEVAKGVRRAQLFDQGTTVASRDDLLAGHAGISMLPASPDKPVTISGLPFDIGRDGMLYDPTGRPFMLRGNELIPLSQLDHYVMTRRLLQQGAETGNQSLKAIAQPTYDLYFKLLNDPKAAEGITVRDDATQRKADQAYKIAPQPEVGEVLAGLTDLSKVDSTKLFAINGGGGFGSQVSAALSKYNQLDLELWYVERGLRDQKQTEQAEQVHAHRVALFEQAKAELAKHSDATRVSADNPLGFRLKYEKMMYDESPLRFGSLDEARAALGDSKMVVWRGDYAFARAIGMAPNNDIRQPDAKAVANERAKKNQITNLVDDLTKLEGTAVGRQYICTTTDLSLLAAQFANTSNSQTVSLAGLPPWLRQRVLDWLSNGQEVTPEHVQELRKTAVERGDSVVPSEEGGKELKDMLGVPGTIVKAKVTDKASGSVEVTAPRKAFKLVIEKDGLLPGIYSLGGPTFEEEQELHGLDRVMPWEIKGAYTADSLKEEMPVTNGPKPASTVEETKQDPNAVG